MCVRRFPFTKKHSPSFLPDFSAVVITVCFPALLKFHFLTTLAPFLSLFWFPSEHQHTHTHTRKHARSRKKERERLTGTEIEIHRERKTEKGEGEERGQNCGLHQPVSGRG